MRAAPARAHEAGGVAFVDAEQRAELVADRTDFIQARHGAVHREHAVGEHQLEARAVGIGLLQLGAQVVEVVVLVAVALCLGEPDAVDDRRMVQRVADHGVFRAQQGLEQAAVGVEGRAVEDGVFGTEEAGQPRLQRLVEVLRAADEAHRAEAEAVGAQGFVGGLDHLRVRGQPQVVVGAEVDYFPAVSRADDRALRRGDDALALVQPRVADGIQFRADGCVEGLGTRHGPAPGGSVSVVRFDKSNMFYITNGSCTITNT
ncbi:hypothetical protein D3C81_938390 [compost metagenome]